MVKYSWIPVLVEDSIYELVPMNKTSSVCIIMKYILQPRILKPRMCLLFSTHEKLVPMKIKPLTEILTLQIKRFWLALITLFWILRYFMVSAKTEENEDRNCEPSTSGQGIEIFSLHIECISGMDKIKITFCLDLFHHFRLQTKHWGPRSSCFIGVHLKQIYQ